MRILVGLVVLVLVGVMLSGCVNYGANNNAGAINESSLLNSTGQSNSSAPPVPHVNVHNSINNTSTSPVFPWK